jgi:hypothetical protein
MRQPETRRSVRPVRAHLWCALMLWGALPVHAQDLDATDVRVGLDSALRIAQRTAASAFPDLANYLLYSVSPRVLKGDPGGLHWQVQWQERAFPHRRWLIVRVYMKDGHTGTERLDAQPPPSAETEPP